MSTKQPGRPKVNPGEQKAVMKLSKTQSMPGSGLKCNWGTNRMEGWEEDTGEAGQANADQLVQAGP